MRKILCAVLTASLAAPAAFVVATPASAAKFWKCDTSAGYGFETNGGDSARCHRPETTVTAGLAPCPPGTTVVTNPSAGVTRNRDQCLIPINRTFTDRICQLPTDRYNARAGTDNCTRVTRSADDRAPHVEVNR